jgi:hypothetical protein
VIFSGESHRLTSEQAATVGSLLIANLYARCNTHVADLIDSIIHWQDLPQSIVQKRKAKSRPQGQFVTWRCHRQRILALRWHERRL